MLLRMPSNWLKIPKSVIVTDFPLSSFKYLMYLAEMCCDFPKLVSGRWMFLVEILLFYCGRGGCRWHFLAPLTCVIPHADSCTIICTVRQRHRYKFGTLRWLASKSICNQQASRHAQVLKMFLIFAVSSYFLSSNIHSGPIYPNFCTFSMIFEIFLNIRSPKT